MNKTLRPSIARKRDNINNKRWTDAEVNLLLKYLQEQSEIEKPTARLFYRKLLSDIHIDATWSTCRWKVKNLKNNYIKAQNWKQSTAAAFLETKEGILAAQDQLRKMCRFYDKLDDIFGQKIAGIGVFDSVTAVNNEIDDTPVIDSISDDQIEFQGFESIDEINGCSLKEFVTVKNECLDAQSSSSCPLPENTNLPILPSPVYTSVAGTDIQHKSVHVQTCTSPFLPSPVEIMVPVVETGFQQQYVQKSLENLKRPAFKNTSDKLFLDQSERIAVLQIEFEKEKFRKEFEFKERQFEEERNEKIQKLEQQKLEMEEHIKDRQEKFELKKMEMEKDERLRILELEKQERVEKFEIEMRYKYGSLKRD